MTVKTLHSFTDLQSTGLDKIPKNGIVQVETVAGGNPMYFTLLSTEHTDPNITMLQFLSYYTTEWRIIGSNIKHKWDEVKNVITVEI